MLRMYEPEHDCWSWSVQWPTLKGLFSPPSLWEDISALNRWSYRYQWEGIPRYPSHTMAKTTACIIEFGLKLCSSTS